MEDEKAPIAENKAFLKNVPCGNECFLQKDLLSEHDGMWR